MFLQRPLEKISFWVPYHVTLLLCRLRRQTAPYAVMAEKGSGQPIFELTWLGGVSQGDQLLNE